MPACQHWLITAFRFAGPAKWPGLTWLHSCEATARYALLNSGGPKAPVTQCLLTWSIVYLLKWYTRVQSQCMDCLGYLSGVSKDIPKQILVNDELFYEFKNISHFMRNLLQPYYSFIDYNTFNCHSCHLLFKLLYKHEHLSHSTYNNKWM